MFAIKLYVPDFEWPFTRLPSGSTLLRKSFTPFIIFFIIAVESLLLTYAFSFPSSLPNGRVEQVGDSIRLNNVIFSNTIDAVSEKTLASPSNNAIYLKHLSAVTQYPGLLKINSTVFNSSDQTRNMKARIHIFHKDKMTLQHQTSWKDFAISPHSQARYVDDTSFPPNVFFVVEFKEVLS